MVLITSNNMLSSAATKLSFQAPRCRRIHFALTEQRDIAEKVEHIRKKLRTQTKFCSQSRFDKLIVIDHIQRLGIEHHFQDEIRDALDKEYVKCFVNGRNRISKFSHDQLHEIALRFRLLRQEGYYISPDIFENLKDKRGKFEEDRVHGNVEGLMSLYEASYMMMEGEDILEEANAFCGRLLRNLDKPCSEIINNTLKNPFHRSLPKFNPNLEGQSKGWANELGELAKMDLELAATAYKDDFHHFSRWWEAVGLGMELKKARNEPLKWFLWAVAAMPDPDLSKERVEITKPVSLIYIVDDLFDVYGQLNHLTHFTKAINRWESDAVEELPEYMRSTWRAIFDTTNEISHQVWIKHGWNPINSLQKQWAEFCNGSLQEARWNQYGYSPTTEEYLKNGIITSGVPIVLHHAFYLLSQTLNTKMLGLLNHHPTIISYVAIILRLSDDLICAKDEGQDGYDGSYVKCYLNKNKEVSVETARQHVDGMISDAWKGLNKESLHLYPHPFSSSHSFGKACMNSARMVSLMYNYNHDDTLPLLHNFLKLF